MIKLPGITSHPLTRQIRGKKHSSAAGAEFSEFMPDIEETRSAARPAAASPISASNPLLSLQEISDDEWQHKRAAKEGHLTLDMLEDLRLALLTGSVSVAHLHQIEAMAARERTQIEDGLLKDILDEIELRAAVELAKLEQAAEHDT